MPIHTKRTSISSINKADASGAGPKKAGLAPQCNFISSQSIYSKIRSRVKYTNKISKEVTLFNITYTDDSLKEIINEATSILNTIAYTPNPININIESKEYNDNSILGEADITTNTISLNTNIINISNYYLNKKSYKLGTIILIHELLHIMGVGNTTNAKWNNFYNSDNFTYGSIESNGVKQYNNFLQNYNIKYKDISYNELPIENNIGSGSDGAHLEEGLKLVNEIYKPDNISYHVIPEEIITPIINRNNYLTIITLGILQDLGYTVNYNSNNVFNHLLDNSSVTILEP